MAGGGSIGGAQHSAGTIELNVVPLVDVACTLILFFIVTTRLTEQNFVELTLAAPVESVAKKTKNPNSIIVSVVCRFNPNDKNADPNQTIFADCYKVLGERFEVGDIDKLKDELSKRYKLAMKDGCKSEEFFVEIRADKRIGWPYIKPVLQAAGFAGVPKMYITAMEAK